MTSVLLADVRPWGGDAVDVTIVDGLISELSPAGSGGAADERIDGRGLLALPGFVNAHAHVDKSWWGQKWVSYGGEPTTQGRIAHERAERDKYGIPSVDSTKAVLREFVRHGTTATRTHVDVDLGVGLRGIAGVLEAADDLNGAVEIELVAFPQDGVLRRPGVLELLDKAAAEGATSIGGLDPATIDRDPVGQLDALFEIATRRDVGLDLHLHDHGDLGAFQYELIAERTIQAGLQGKVNVSHGFALGELPSARRADLVQLLGEAGISWTTVAPPASAPLPFREMRAAGVPIGLGTDGIRDLWSPYGDGDLLQVARGFARLHGLRTDEDLTYAVELATTYGAPFVHRENHGLTVGARADIVLLDAENAPDVLVRAPRREVVIAAGQVVVRDGELQV
ncbi:amidohydrolase family protein [Kribbella jejuensis]|uniref:Cytosine deaminase n=1 Tax=Kribbella jejuensis TaxID=236068 RepID=A0A542EN38_9ACTN|nr:amidohydrolase [Kribbella jejuensis]TQJ16771.1 cytosine deaminase [Kribbella jejuensis]